MNIRNNLSSGRAVRQWHRMPIKVVESPSLEVSKSRVDVALTAMGSGHCVMGCWLDWVSLEVFSNLNDSMRACLRRLGALLQTPASPPKRKWNYLS